MNKTHSCGELTIKENKDTVKLIGWARRIRDHGGKKFIDLKDREGFTQVVFDPDVTENFDEVTNFKREYLIQVFGKVRPRPDGTKNDKLKTGEIEVIVERFVLVNKCETLPFELDDEGSVDVNEELRLEYRYLDLRRESMQKSLINRSRFVKSIRDTFDKEGFIEVDTPILTASSPEGARDFLVPSRKHPGSFFALPQAPQLFKQILMVSGLEKYYQIATCFRDEDLRKDRQYEFKQVDMEVSFYSQEELFTFMNKVISKSFKDVYGVNVTDKIDTLTYKEAMDKYGCDKPDLRIKGMELKDISDISANCGFSVFKGVVERGGLVKGFNLKGGQDLMSRKDIDKLIEFSQELGAKGLAWMKVIEGDKIESSITKFFTETELEEIRNKLEGKTGDLLFFVADTKSTTNDVLDGLRRKLANDFDLMDKNKHILTWVVDFPLFHWDEGSNKLDFEHNPFTMPLESDVEYLMSVNASDIEKEKNRLLDLVSDCYDLVYNGVEIASGAKRIHLPELQNKMFELCGFTQKQIEDGFGWFVRAYNYGAPPHRGCALGLDRMIMILEGASSIRDVIAFPRNKHGFDPMTQSPAKVDESQLKELGIKLDVKEKKKEE